MSIFKSKRGAARNDIPRRLRPSRGLKKAVVDLEHYAREVEKRDSMSAKGSTNPIVDDENWGI